MRKVGQLDNRGSHFYLAMYWANELAKQTDSPSLKATFEKVISEMQAKEKDIISELNNAPIIAPIALIGEITKIEKKIINPEEILSEKAI